MQLDKITTDNQQDQQKNEQDKQKTTKQPKMSKFKNQNEINKKNKKQKQNQEELLVFTQQLNPNDLNALVDKIINLKSYNDKVLINHYSVEYIFSLLDENVIQQLELKFKISEKYDGGNGIDIITFVRIFLQLLSHGKEETIYLTMQVEKDNTEAIGITEKQMPQLKQFNYDHNRVREIDINPPIIYGNDDTKIKRLKKNTVYTDSQRHTENTIKISVYSPERKQIILIDSLAKQIQFYNEKCELIFKLQPHEDRQHLQGGELIFGIEWSEKQQRLGAVLQDCSICFWDAKDNFKLEKCINVLKYQLDIQENIWYLDRINEWVTTDKKNSIHFWDIQMERKKKSLYHSKIQSTIIKIIEIPQAALQAVASMDKIITIWNFDKGIIVNTIQCGRPGVQYMEFSQNYQVLGMVGYENQVKLYEIHPKYNDIQLKGSLIGHTTVITAFKFIENTPMILSGDNQGNLKLWDIRTLKCIQSITYGSKTQINNILDLQNGQVAFTGSRVNILDFFNKDQIVKNQNNQENYPIFVQINNTQNQLIVCQRRQITYLDIQNGRNKKIIQNLVDKDDDIATFQTIDTNQKFLIGTQKGSIQKYLVENGQLIGQLENHQQEITQMKIDHQNGLITTGSWDSTVKVQQLNLNDKVTPCKRQIKGCFFNKKIEIIEISPYHNLLITSSDTEEIYIWDYEHFNLLFLVRLSKNVQPTSIAILNGYPIIIIAGNDGSIYILEFKRGNDLQLNIDPVGHFNINQDFYQKEPIKISKILNSNRDEGEHKTQNSFNKKNSKNLQFKKYTNSMGTQVFNSKLSLNTPQSQKNQLQSKSLVNEKLKKISVSNTSSYQKLMSDIKSSESKYSNQDHFDFNELQEYSEQQEPEPQFSDNVELDFFTKILINYQYDINDLGLFQLIAATNKGQLKIYDLGILQKYYQFKYVKPVKDKSNYNPFRNRLTDFNNEINKLLNKQVLQLKRNIQVKEPQNKPQKESFQNILGNLNQSIQISFNPHKDQLTCLQFLNLGQKYLVTASMDNYIKFFQIDTFEQVVSININHPLPIKWDIKVKKQEKQKKKVFLAVQILDLIKKKYQPILTMEELNNLDLEQFLEKVDKLNLEHLYIDTYDQIKNKDNNKKSVEQNYQEEQDLINNKVILLKDEFEPRDIKYDVAKKIYEREVKGPSIQIMEIQKKTQENQENYEIGRGILKDQTPMQIQVQKLQNEIKEKEDLLYFDNLYMDVQNEKFEQTLNQNYRRNILNKINNLDDDQDKPYKIKELSSKMDLAVNPNLIKDLQMKKSTMISDYINVMNLGFYLKQLKDNPEALYKKKLKNYEEQQKQRDQEKAMNKAKPNFYKYAQELNIGNLEKFGEDPKFKSIFDTEESEEEEEKFEFKTNFDQEEYEEKRINKQRNRYKSSYIINYDEHLFQSQKYKNKGFFNSQYNLQNKSQNKTSQQSLNLYGGIQKNNMSRTQYSSPNIQNITITNRQVKKLNSVISDLNQKVKKSQHSFQRKDDAKFLSTFISTVRGGNFYFPKQKTSDDKQKKHKKENFFISEPKVTNSKQQRYNSNYNNQNSSMEKSFQMTFLTQMDKSSFKKELQNSSQKQTLTQIPHLQNSIQNGGSQVSSFNQIPVQSSQTNLISSEIIKNNNNLYKIDEKKKVQFSQTQKQLDAKNHISFKYLTKQNFNKNNLDGYSTLTQSGLNKLKVHFDDLEQKKIYERNQYLDLRKQQSYVLKKQLESQEIDEEEINKQQLQLMVKQKMSKIEQQNQQYYKEKTDQFRKTQKDSQVNSFGQINLPTLQNNDNSQNKQNKLNQIRDYHKVNQFHSQENSQQYYFKPQNISSNNNLDKQLNYEKEMNKLVNKNQQHLKCNNRSTQSQNISNTQLQSFYQENTVQTKNSLIYENTQNYSQNQASYLNLTQKQ